MFSVGTLRVIEVIVKKEGLVIVSMPAVRSDVPKEFVLVTLFDIPSCGLRC